MKKLNDYIELIEFPDEFVNSYGYLQNNSLRYSYNYFEIVKDYIMEYELYKKPYNCKKISNQIIRWFYNKKDKKQIKINEIDKKMHISELRKYIYFFYENNKELFIIGEAQND